MIGRSFTDPAQPLQAFGFVFVLEAAMVLLGIVILRQLNTAEFRHDTETRMETLLMAGLDD